MTLFKKKLAKIGNCYHNTLKKMKLKKKHREMMRHYERFIDRCRWPDYTINDLDFYNFLQKESGNGNEVVEPLLWAKKLEEITITQMWHELADSWSGGFGWYYVWLHNLKCAWAERKGSNVMVRKILKQKRLIDKGGGNFIEAVISCSYFNSEDKDRYINRWLNNN